MPGHPEARTFEGGGLPTSREDARAERAVDACAERGPRRPTGPGVGVSSGTGLAVSGPPNLAVNRCRPATLEV